MNTGLSISYAVSEFVDDGILDPMLLKYLINCLASVGSGCIDVSSLTDGLVINLVLSNPSTDFTHSIS